MTNHINLPVTITPSRAELGARCHRRHFLSDILSLAGFYSPSLEFGSVIHAGAAAHWLNVKTGQGDPYAALRAEWQKRFEENPKVSQESVSLQMAEAMLEYYIANATLAGPFGNDGWQLIDVEQRFELPIRDIFLSFQCDRIVYNKDEDWLVAVDTKTAGRLDARWMRQWEMSLQMKLYRVGIKTVFDAMGKVDVVVEGVLKHVPSSLSYVVCPEWSNNMLAEAVHNANVIASIDRDIIVQGSDVYHNAMTPNDKQLLPNQAKIEELAVRFTPVNYADCYSYNVECPFRKLCTADIPERIGILRGEYFETEEELY